MKTIGLDALGIGEEGRVSYLADGCAMRRRLLDLGFTGGARARCLFASPSGDPRAYRVRETVIALRGEDAKRVRLFQEARP